MSVPELRPLAVGEIIDVALKIWRRHFWTLVRIVVVVVAPLAILSSLIVNSVAVEPGPVGPTGEDIGGLLAGGFTAVILGLLGFMLASAACLQAVSVAYGVGKAGVDRMSRDMGRELRAHGVTVVSIWPGIVKTERHLAEQLGLDPSLHGESAQFSGRAVAALAADPDRLTRTGQALVVAELAREYGFTDVDGRLPPSLRR